MITTLSWSENTKASAYSNFKSTFPTTKLILTIGPFKLGQMASSVSDVGMPNIAGAAKAILGHAPSANIRLRQHRAEQEAVAWAKDLLAVSAKSDEGNGKQR